MSGSDGDDKALARAIYRHLMAGGSCHRRPICDALDIGFRDIDRAVKASGGHLINRLGTIQINWSNRDDKRNG